MADATAATTPKIDELRARLKAEPKSRHFYPLAEELRKLHQFEQAEEILREGLQHHPGYLSAWISLGRVLRDRSRDHEAVEVLKRALSLDGGNVVAAKLLAQAYLGVGDKVEAIKKFKLVFALMPADAEVEAEIERLDRELNPEKFAPAVEVAPAASAPPVVVTGPGPEVEALPEAGRFDLTDSHPFSVEDEPFVATSEAALSNLLEQGVAEESAPLAADPAAPELPDGAPFPADVLSVDGGVPEPEPFEAASLVEPPDMAPAIFAEADAAAEETELEDVPSSLATPIPATLTMAQLFERQGHLEQAKALFAQILEQEPDNEDARAGLSRLGEAESAVPASSQVEKVKRLQTWRAKVARS